MGNSFCLLFHDSTSMTLQILQLATTHAENQFGPLPLHSSSLYAIYITDNGHGKREIFISLTFIDEIISPKK